MGLEIDDLHELVVGIFLGSVDSGNVLILSSLKYLGTGFFVSKQGDIITAQHILPREDSLKQNQKIFVSLRNKMETEFYGLVGGVEFEETDYAILNAGNIHGKYFEINFEAPRAGTDVLAFGISSHKVHGEGWELRTLKGYTTMPSFNGFQELSFPIQQGMNGGPVLVGTKCVGIMLGSIKSEEIVDSIEEIEEISDSKEKYIY